MQRPRETCPVRAGARVWILRAVWVTLPVTAGSAVSMALEQWADTPRVTAFALAWLAWGIGAVAVLAPRPLGLTAIRTIAPAFALGALAIAVTGAADGLEAWGAFAAAAIGAVLVADHELAFAAGAAVAYGDEERFPLRTPPALFLGPLWLVRALVVTAVAGPPLLLADERVLAGVGALVVGVPVVVLGVRALHGLSRRWLVLVPAGVVVVDPLTLPDPVLIVRRQIRRLRAFNDPVRPRDGALDLRLGATSGTVAIRLDEPLEVVHAGRARRGGTTTRTELLYVAVSRRDDALAAAARRRVRVEA
jgi:hypothetical protein